MELSPVIIRRRVLCDEGPLCQRRAEVLSDNSGSDDSFRFSLVVVVKSPSAGVHLLPDFM